MKWYDANGLRVEYMDLSLTGRPDPGGTARPTPFDGPQFCVARISPVDQRWVPEGYARTDADLTALGVSAGCLTAIQRWAP